MNLEKMSKVTFYVILVLIILINLITFQYLPDKVGLQITFKGELANYAPKVLFVIVGPLILIIGKVFYRYSARNETSRLLLISIIIFIINILTVITNLKLR